MCICVECKSSPANNFYSKTYNAYSKTYLYPKWTSFNVSFVSEEIKLFVIELHFSHYSDLQNQLNLNMLMNCTDVWDLCCKSRFPPFFHSHTNLCTIFDCLQVLKWCVPYQFRSCLENLPLLSHPLKPAYLMLLDCSRHLSFLLLCIFVGAIVMKTSLYL